MKESHFMFDYTKSQTDISNLGFLEIGMYMCFGAQMKKEASPVVEHLILGFTT